MKKFYYFFSCVILIEALLVFDRIWFKFIEEAIFIKLSATLAVISIAALLMIFIYREFVQEKKMRDEDYLN